MWLSLNNRKVRFETCVKRIVKDYTVIFLKMNLVGYLQYTWLDNVILSGKYILLISVENGMVYFMVSISWGLKVEEDDG